MAKFVNSSQPAPGKPGGRQVGKMLYHIYELSVYKSANRFRIRLAEMYSEKSYIRTQKTPLSTVTGELGSQLEFFFGSVT